MQQNFIFYDTETSDRDPFFGQIFQLAAVLTDADLNPIDSFDIRSKRLPQILPSPGALLVNGLDPVSLDQAPYTNYEFAGEVRRRFMAWTPAITCGYNSFGFDEKCLRSLFYQNLYPPYVTQLDGNSRIDILPLTQATEILYPDALVFPLNDKGKTSKKLEHVAPANGFEEHNAHDALGDVEATIHVARLIKSRAPVLWQAALAARTRRDATARAERAPLVYVHDRNFGHPVTFPAMIIGRVHNGRDLLAADLGFDAPDTAATGPDRLFKGPERHCRVIKSGEAPLIFSPEEFVVMPHGRSWDQSEIEARIQAWQAIQAKENVPAMYAEWQTPLEPAEYPEGAIYEDFDAFDRDAMAMRAFHDATPTQKQQVLSQLTDPRFRNFARRIIFDNFPQLLSDVERANYENAIHQRLNNEDEVPWVTVNKAKYDIEKLKETHPARKEELQRIYDYLDRHK
jgi:exodeoxyribonuclease-1